MANEFAASYLEGLQCGTARTEARLKANAVWTQEEIDMAKAKAAQMRIDLGFEIQALEDKHKSELARCKSEIERLKEFEWKYKELEK
jgi:hypothetical protein